jgi:hypothetical protein
MSLIIAYIMSSLIVIFGLGIAYVNLLIMRRARRMGWRIMYSLIALYWALVYGYLLFAPMVSPPGAYGSTWVRPGLVFTLGWMFAMSLERYKVIQHNGKSGTHINADYT